MVKTQAGRMFAPVLEGKSTLLTARKEAFTLAEGATHVGICTKTRQYAFTLAEVLITLAIIGVVATMTIPTLIAEYNQKSWDTATSVFNRRLGEALKIMNASGTLANHDTTAEFVEELSKHIKIVKTCDNTNLTDCFVSQIANTGDKPIETSKLKKSKNLYSTEDYGTDTMGVMFGDGVSALIAYNKNTPYDPYSNEIVSVNGDGKSVSLSTKAVSILYDVNGLKSPNEYGTGTKDIRELNINIKTGATVKLIGIDYTAVDCSSAGASSDDYKYCTARDIKYGYTNTYWAGAKKKCAEFGMTLPETGIGVWQYCPLNAAQNTLCGIYNDKEFLGINSSGIFFSANAGPISGDTPCVGVLDFNGSTNGYIQTAGINSQYNVVCVGD